MAEITAAPWLVVIVAVEELFSKEYRLGRLCGGLLSESMALYRAFIDHRSAFIACWASDVVGNAKMFALSSAVPLHLIYKVLPLSPL